MYHTMVKRVFFEPSCFRARPFPRLPRAPYAALKPSLNDKITRMSCHRHRTTTVMYRPRGHHQSRAILARTRCRLSDKKTKICCSHPRRALAVARIVGRAWRSTDRGRRGVHRGESMSLATKELSLCRRSPSSDFLTRTSPSPKKLSS